MPPQARLDSAQIARMEAALQPYAWKRMTVRAVAFRLVEAIENCEVAVDDGRVWIVERVLSACRWRGLTVAGRGGLHQMIRVLCAYTEASGCSGSASGSGCFVAGSAAGVC